MEPGFSILPSGSSFGRLGLPGIMFIYTHLPQHRLAKIINHTYHGCYMDVSKNRGFYTPKWMVYFMENPMNKWMIWGETPLFLETPIYGHLENRILCIPLQEVFQFFAATLHVLLAMGFPLHRWSGLPSERNVKEPGNLVGGSFHMCDRVDQLPLFP